MTKSSEHLRLLIQNRPDLLVSLEGRMQGLASGAALIDPDGEPIWSSPDAPLDRAEEWKVPLADYGEVKLWGPHSHDHWAQVVATLLTACIESEAELNQLVDDHISTTNQLMALYNIVYGTHGTWDLNEKLRVIVQEAGKQSDSRCAFLGRAEGSEVPLQIYSRGGSDDTELARRVLARAARERSAHLGTPPDSFVAAPVLLHGEVFGWLVVAERREPYLGRDLKLVQALADLAAGFLLTARLQAKVVETFKLGRELELAAQIQELLIPRELPQVPGVEICATCHPASQVGGDFYAVQTLPDGDLVFAVGDVAGKGIPAAMLMAMARTIFRSLAAIENSPGRILAHMNEVLYDDLERVGKFVTLVVGRYYTQKRMVAIANAGHSPVFSISAHGALPSLLEPTLPPVGILPVIEPVETTLTLRADSVLVITSDGVTEARSPQGGLFGMERLTQVFEAGTRATAAELAHRLLAQVSGFSAGAEQSDDQTLLILKGTR
ncbi:MAG: PP2C family protein-serine/threonine phosphatase [Candidatus Eisenbacteria bacterium]